MDRKTCTICGKTKPNTSEHFVSRGKRRGGTSSHCRGCHARQNRERRRRQRLEALQHYSGGKPECACCGENALEFLGFDHVGGGGGKHRRDSNAAVNMATWLKNGGYPSGFQVLCHNCNLAIGIYGYCPHREAGRWFDDLPESVHASSQLYCGKGHPMFGEYLWITGKTRKRRVCRECKNEATRSNRKKRKSASLLRG